LTEPGAPGEPAAAGQDVPDQQVTLNRKAVLSVVCGVLAFACIYVSPFGGFVLSLPSLTSGVHARREIVAAKGQQTGDTLAVTGLMIGGGAMVTVVLSELIVLLAG
jgi:hypothetical protein